MKEFFKHNLIRRILTKKTLSILIVFIFLAIIFYIPILRLLNTAFTDTEGRITLEYFKSIFTRSYNLRVISFTFKEAFLSALVTLLLGLPGAYIVSHFDFKGKSLLLSLTTVPFVLPPLLVALGFILLFGSNGLVNRILMSGFGLKEPLTILYSFAGIIMVHAFYNFPVIVRIVGAQWEGISEKYTFAARSLGANPIQTFFRVTLPLILPAIISSFSIVFLFCFLSFAIILTIGGASYATLEVSIYTYFTMFSDFKTGSALAIFQGLFSLFVVYIYLKVGNLFKTGALQRTFSEKEKLISSKPRFFLSMLYFIVVLILIIAPTLVVILYAFLNPFTLSPTLENFKELFSGRYNFLFGVSPARVFLNSMLFAVATIIVSNVLSLIIGFSVKGDFKAKNALLTLLMLPLAISPITIALSYVISFRAPVNVLNSPFAILFAHILASFPFALRTIMPVIETTSDSFVYAARSLGLSGFRSFIKVELNLIKPSLIASSTFIFAISLGEFGATFMLYRPQYTTLTVALYRLLSGRHYGPAAAIGGIFVILNIIVFFIIDRLARNR